MVFENIEEKRDNLVESVVETDRKFIEMTIDAVVDYFEKIEETSSECGSEGKVCPGMIAKETAGMPVLNESRIQQVLDVMHRDGLLEREIPEATGVPHYSLK